MQISSYMGGLYATIEKVKQHKSMTTPLSDSQVQDQLAQASEGLTYTSETDAPFEVYSTSVFYITSKMRTLTIDEFFETAIVHQTWHDEEDHQTVERFQALVSLLKLSLSNAKVYLFGEQDITAYIVGLTASGNIAGLKTTLVWT